MQKKGYGNALILVDQHFVVSVIGDRGRKRHFLSVIAGNASLSWSRKYEF